MKTSKYNFDKTDRTDYYVIHSYSFTWYDF